MHDQEKKTTHTHTLIVGIIRRHRTGDPVVLRLAALEEALRRSRRHDPHVPVPHRTPLAVADLKIHGVGVQRVSLGEIPQNRQRGPVNAPGQMFVVGVLREDLHLAHARVCGDGGGDGDGQRERWRLRVDPAVA